VLLAFELKVSHLLGPVLLQHLQQPLLSGMTGTLDKVQLTWLRWDCFIILVQLTSEHHPSSLYLTSSWDYVHESPLVACSRYS
jgi:hypothetical protein